MIIMVESINLEELRESLINMYIRERKSYREICNDLKISKKTLHDYLKKLDIPARKRGTVSKYVIKRTD